MRQIEAMIMWAFFRQRGAVRCFGKIISTEFFYTFCCEGQYARAKNVYKIAEILARICFSACLHEIQLLYVFTGRPRPTEQLKLLEEGIDLWWL